MSDLLLDTPLNAEQTAYAKAVKASGDLLLALIDEILDFSKIEAGHLEINARPFDLHALVEETVELIAPRAQEKDLDIGAYIEDCLPVTVIGDPARLRQVLLNLAGNAIQFTEYGGGGNRADRPRRGRRVWFPRQAHPVARSAHEPGRSLPEL